MLLSRHSSDGFASELRPYPCNTASLCKFRCSSVPSTEREPPPLAAGSRPLQQTGAPRRNVLNASHYSALTTLSHTAVTATRLSLPVDAVEAFFQKQCVQLQTGQRLAHLVCSPGQTVQLQKCCGELPLLAD